MQRASKPFRFLIAGLGPRRAEHATHRFAGSTDRGDGPGAFPSRSGRFYAVQRVDPLARSSMMTAPTPRTPGRAAFVFIFVTVMLDMLALGVMAPVLPKLVLAFKGGEIADAVSITGVFGFTWAAMQ